MRLLGRALSVLARLILRNPWRRLNKELEYACARFRTGAGPRIPSILIATLVAAEDHRFFTHGGVDPIAIGRALWRRMTGRKLGGASTIEQQLVRTLTRQYERTVRRKVREIMLATLVDGRLPKAEIAGLYLSLAYFGWRMNGIQQACNRLQIDLPRATPREAASIVARLKYPEPRAPSPRRARQIAARTDYVLRLMAKRSRAAIEAAVQVHGTVVPAAAATGLYGPDAGKMAAVLQAIAGRESGGRYDAVSAVNVPQRGRALGKYQFMPETLLSLGYGQCLASRNPADYQDLFRARDLASAFLNQPYLQEDAAVSHLGVLARKLRVEWERLTEADVARLAAAWVGGAGMAKSPERWDRAPIGPGMSATVRDYVDDVLDRVRRDAGSVFGIVPVRLEPLGGDSLSDADD